VSLGKVFLRQIDANRESGRGGRERGTGEGLAAVRWSRSAAQVRGREDEIQGPADPPSHCTLISSGGTARRAEGLLIDKLDWKHE